MDQSTSTATVLVLATVAAVLAWTSSPAFAALLR